MSTKKTVKTPSKKDELTPAEKKLLSQAAKAVKKSHEGSPKPQLLTKLKPNDKVQVVTFPMVRWVIKNGECIRETDVLNINCDAKDVEGFKKILAVPELVKKIKAKLSQELYERTKFSLNEWSAIYQAQRQILRMVERLEIDVRFNDQTNISIADIRTVLGKLCRQLRTLDEWDAAYSTIQSQAKENVDVLPDASKYKFDPETGKFYLNEDYKKLIDDRLAQLKKKD